MSQRFIAKGAPSDDGTTIQLVQVIQDQDGRYRPEPLLDPIPVAEVEAKIAELLPSFDGRWKGPLPPRLF